MKPFAARAQSCLLALCMLPVGVGSQTARSSKVSEIGPSGLSRDCTFEGAVRSIKIREAGRTTAVCTFRRDGQSLEASYFREEGGYQRFVNLYDAKGALREADIYDNEEPQHPIRQVIRRDGFRKPKISAATELSTAARCTGLTIGGTRSKNSVTTSTAG